MSSTERPKVVVFLSDEAKKVVGSDFAGIVKEWGKVWLGWLDMHPVISLSEADYLASDLVMSLERKSSLSLIVKGELFMDGRVLNLMVSLKQKLGDVIHVI